MSLASRSEPRLTDPPPYLRLGATVTILRHKEVHTGGKKRTRKMSVTELLVRKVPDDQEVGNTLVAETCRLT